MSIITTRTLQRLWEDAQHYPEWATTRLWEHIFNRIAFPGDPWLVSSQQPPTLAPGDLRRVDLVVEQADPAQGSTATRLFMEAKRASAAPSDIVTVEVQAYTAACASALQSNPNDPIWVMTCVGSAARLWIFDWDQAFLVPYFPATHAEAKSEYIEISKRGTELLKHLSFIKKHPRPPKHLVGKASPRPSAELPADWPDDEVMLRDAQHQQVDYDPVDPMIGGAGDVEMTDDPYHDGGYGSTLPSTYPAPTPFTGGYDYEEGHSTSLWPQTTSVDGTLSPEGMPGPEGNLLEPGPTSTSFPDGSTVTGNPGTTTTQAEKWSRVELRKKRHLSRPTEYLFTTDKSHEKSTDADEWREAKHKGKKAWYYLHKGVKYYTREKPGV